MNGFPSVRLSKVPEVTLVFWIIKILATTLGETGGDALSMTMKLGYAISSAIFFTIFIVTVVAQVAAKRFHPFLYWAVIVAATTAGTRGSVDPVRAPCRCPRGAVLVSRIRFG
jgi:uncharacterized membrane-anchored protein